jgi:hypothetical protein
MAKGTWREEPVKSTVIPSRLTFTAAAIFSGSSKPSIHASPR